MSLAVKGLDSRVLGCAVGCRFLECSGLGEAPGGFRKLSFGH